MSARIPFQILIAILLASPSGFAQSEVMDECVSEFTDKQLTATARKDNKQVIALSKKGLKECGEHPSLYFNMAMPLVSLGKQDAAENALRKCVELDPLHTACLKNLGNLYSEQGRYADAILQYEKMLEIDPEDDDAMDNMAVVRIREGNIADAIATANRAVAAQPSNIHARITLARAYLAGDHWREAIDAIDDACYINPGHPGVQEASGHVRFTAREPILRQTEGAQDDAWAQYYRAKVASTLEESRNGLHRAIRLDSEQPRILAEYVYWLEPDKLQESLETLEKCLNIDSEYWPCLMLKAERLRGAGQASEARSAFETGQKIAPYVPTFYWFLGVLLARQGDEEGALEQLELGFKHGENPLFRRLAAKLYKSQGNLDMAMWHASMGAMAGDAQCRDLLRELEKLTR